MSAAAGRPPSLSPQSVCKLVSRYFRVRNVIEGSVKEFPSYDDATYYLRGEFVDSRCAEFVLKLGNPVYTSFPVMRSINKLMCYISSKGYKFLTPCPVQSSSGSNFLSLTREEVECLSPNGNSVSGSSVKNPALMESMVQLLTFIPGELLDNIEKKCLTPALLKEVGEMIATVDKDLKV